MWAIEHIGKPWVAGARGPDAFDCGGWLRFAFLTQHGIVLPEWGDVNPKNPSQTAPAILGAAQSDIWHEVEEPVDFCAVAMSQSRVIHHVGLYLDVDGGLILHACDGKGLIAQSLSQLAGSGWRTLIFYQHQALRDVKP